jgi:hypothetical protein
MVAMGGRYCRIRGISNQNVLPFLLDVSQIAYIDTDQYVYYWS